MHQLHKILWSSSGTQRSSNRSGYHSLKSKVLHSTDFFLIYTLGIASKYILFKNLFALHSIFHNLYISIFIEYSSNHPIEFSDTVTIVFCYISRTRGQDITGFISMMGAWTNYYSPVALGKLSAVGGVRSEQKVSEAFVNIYTQSHTAYFGLGLSGF